MLLSRTASYKDKMFGQQRKLYVEAQIKKKKKKKKKKEPEPPVDLEYIKNYLKNEGIKLSKRGAPKSIKKVNFNSDEVDSMEKRVEKKLSKYNPYVKISVNDKGYDGESDITSSLDFYGFSKRRTKSNSKRSKRSKRSVKRKSKKRTKRRSRR